MTRTEIAELLERVREAKVPDREIESLRSRFLDKCIPEPNSGCWIWTGAAIVDPRNPQRLRGVFGVLGRNSLASRASLTLFKCEDVSGAMACHTCDTSVCVNPDHLYVGDHASNMRDMRVRRRSFAVTQPERCAAITRQVGLNNKHAKGAGNPKAKITAEQATEIRHDRRKTSALATLFGVDRTTIQRIRRGALWPIAQGERA